MNLKQTIFLDMAIIINTARNILDERFLEHGLSRQEWLVLGLLRAYPEGVSQRYVKAYLSVETSYLSKILNGLENQKLITRHIDTNDRRNRIIQTNPNLPKNILKLFKIIEQLNEELGADLTATDMQYMQRSLNKIKHKLNTL